MLLGKAHFTELFAALNGASHAMLAEVGRPVIAIGAFIDPAIVFMIIAFAVFTMVRQINR